MTSLQHEPDTSAGQWVSAGLLPWKDRVPVAAVVPAGFEAYARILHPAWMTDAASGVERRVRWAEVAASRGRVMHPLVQWCGLFDSWDERSRGPRVEDGTLAPDHLAALVRLLGPGTPAVYGLWEGHGWIHGGMSVWVDDDGVAHSHRHPPGLPSEVVDGPRLRTYSDAERRHATRAYLLFRGPLAAVGWDEFPPGGPWRQSPNLIWPADRSWCVATEIDFPFTLVGGSRALVDAILAEPMFEVLEVAPDDDMSCGGDTLNPGLDHA